MGFLITLATIVFILVCILLIAVILLQPSSEGGLGAAFGAPGAESFFGTKAISFFWKLTIVLAAIFVLLAIALNQMRTRTATKPLVTEEKKGSSSLIVPLEPPERFC
jgi:preprotein translocase subunit SecG